MEYNLNQSSINVIIENSNRDENIEDLIDKELNLDLVDSDLTFKFKNTFPENEVFREMHGKEVLLVMTAHQLSILGQTFRPIFCGTVVKATNGFITLNPAIVKMSNAPFFRFPTPLSFPMENITHFLPFDCNIPFPIS